MPGAATTPAGAKPSTPNHRLPFARVHPVPCRGQQRLWQAQSHRHQSIGSNSTRSPSTRWVSATRFTHRVEVGKNGLERLTQTPGSRSGNQVSDRPNNLIKGLVAEFVATLKAVRARNNPMNAGLVFGTTLVARGPWRGTAPT